METREIVMTPKIEMPKTPKAIKLVSALGDKIGVTITKKTPRFITDDLLTQMRESGLITGYKITRTDGESKIVLYFADVETPEVTWFSES